MPACTTIKGIDTHAHIFKHTLPMVQHRRYAPDYDAVIEDFFNAWQQVGITHGVLVQPSFYGVDNHFMIEALTRYPTLLRGIAVIDDQTANAANLEALAQQGVVGIRLNLMGLPLPDFKSPHWQSLLKELANRRWQLEIHREAKDTVTLLPDLLESGVHIVLDHFGRPDPALGLKDPALHTILSFGKTGQIWVKLSGDYRNKSDEKTSTEMAALFLEHYGSAKLLWGSDWPHTQFETTENYPKAFEILKRWVAREEDRANILIHTPASLFHFI